MGWEGKVIEVSDGDTLKIMRDRKAEKVRLFGIDSPESQQDFGQNAKKFTADMVLWKTVSVKPVDSDRYGRLVGIVAIDGTILNEELLRAGLAWFYALYCRESICSKWKTIQEQAKSLKNGLWADSNPKPPWEFRKSDEFNVSSGKTSSLIPEAKYHGNVSSMVFHQPDCKDYNCRNCKARYITREEALSKGFHPCRLCQP